MLKWCQKGGRIDATTHQKTRKTGTNKDDENHQKTCFHEM
jgi:hypothetical protein